MICASLESSSSGTAPNAAPDTPPASRSSAPATASLPRLMAAEISTRACAAGARCKIRFVRLVTFCGSIRSGSLNRKLLARAIEVLRASADIDALELRDVPLPIYDGDLEASTGVPEPAKRLADRIAASDGLVIASPEYNNSIPGG